ncbi:cell division protein ZapE [Pseudactinotalea sp. HY158]|uniref:cell division protein ZapE n=1 Tax=Pseudactinotalea sp. HY158 TaxID=2654547 RepID=UPI001E3049C6|nr:cell division protein ZapE [Pseudactinotalea sp. HY158]
MSGGEQEPAGVGSGRQGRDEVALLTLTDRSPRLDRARLLAQQVPPPQFDDASFDSYRPDISHPSQTAALRRMRALAHSIERPRRRLLRGRGRASTGVYLDGGYGVGKTHLIAALAHALGPERALYGTFVEYTHLVGALGFGAAVAELSGAVVLCIDEFELDDPGDTVLMSRLLRELSDAGVTLVATSNTQPGALGEGRFAADDFLREITSLASRFEVMRIDGPDYRARTLDFDRPVPTDGQVRAEATAHAGRGGALDDFSTLLGHLGRVHPSRYGQLVDGVTFLGLTGGATLTDDVAGLRLVVLIDRLYDRGIPVRLAGIGARELVSERMRAGGYRKKYLRAISRLDALSRRDEALGPV